MTTTTIPRPASTERPLVRLALQTGIDSTYLLTGLPLAIVSFIALNVGLSVGVGLLVILVGLPILTATLYVARGFADLERRRIARVLDVPYQPGSYRRADPAAGPWRRLLHPMTDAQSWLDALYGMVAFPLNIVTWSIMITWWSGAVGGLLYFTYGWTLAYGGNNHDLTYYLGMHESLGSRVGFYTAAGIFCAGTLPLASRACARLQTGVGRSLLTGMTEMRTRISGLEQARDTARSQTAAAVSAETTALRRLERDIHDGPQQRLVRLAMDLGRAQHQLDHDPEAARRTVAEALAQTRETLDELRALSRGIAPPILVDRGLSAAVAALAGRSLVPVELDTANLGRLDPGVESTAYFVLAESLTNVAKHSRANECQVVLRRDGGHLEVSITDDGVGGAALAKGHGLAGLADRVHAVGGALTVISPAGGPTTISARLRCR